MADTEIDEFAAGNYDAIVNDDTRNVSYEDIAKRAEELDDARTAAWARERAAQSGKNVTPAKAKTAPKSKRAEDAEK
jgi:hypothetical protein